MSDIKQKKSNNLVKWGLLAMVVFGGSKCYQYYQKNVKPHLGELKKALQIFDNLEYEVNPKKVSIRLRRRIGLKPPQGYLAKLWLRTKLEKNPVDLYVITPKRTSLLNPSNFSKITKPTDLQDFLSEDETSFIISDYRTSKTKNGKATQFRDPRMKPVNLPYGDKSIKGYQFNKLNADGTSVKYIMVPLRKKIYALAIGPKNHFDDEKFEEFLRTYIKPKKRSPAHNKD